MPVLTWIYIAQRPEAGITNVDSYFDNKVLALQYGFAVLVPTINLDEDSFQNSPYRSLSRDVVPAVKSVIASGLVDPHRIYLYGHSYGAYSTYALIEQTNIFAAAAAFNGPSDLLSEYLDIDPNARRYAYPFQLMFSVQGELETEHNYMALGGSPWRNFDAYMDNSPVRYIDRIHTPLLIMHSDTDAFDMHQADNMFAGLVRLGREARYMRIWGEAHSLDSPANIRQFWSTMVDWFNEHQNINAH